MVLGGGDEQRRGLWQNPRRVYNATSGVKTLADLQTLIKHFNGRRGQLRGFPYLDRTGFNGQTDAFGTGDGATTIFQLLIAEGDAANPYNRTVTKPKNGTVHIFDNAVEVFSPGTWSLDYTTGLVTFVAAPVNTHILTWTGQFYVPVRYDADQFPKYEEFTFNAGAGGTGTGIVNAPTLGMIEVRDFQ